MVVMVCSISSLVLTACEFISNDRWVVIRSINSVTGSTLEASNKFCCSVPMPFGPGVVHARRAGGIGLGVEVAAQLQQSLRVDEGGQLDLPDLGQLRVVGLLHGDHARAG